MAFPTPCLAPTLSASQRCEANKKAKREAFKREAEELRAKQAARIPVPKKSPCDPEWEEFISSAGFKSWYEEMTCKSGEKFADWLLNSDAHILYRMSRTEWIAMKIQNLLDDNRWQNPHYRRYWAKNIASCFEPRKRRAIILRLATPKWANMVKVARFHRLRAEISKRTGVPHDVDHEIPLQGKLVCGLNNEFNLRVITASENRSKSNKYLIV